MEGASSLTFLDVSSKPLLNLPINGTGRGWIRRYPAARDEAREAAGSDNEDHDKTGESEVQTEVSA